MKKKEFFGKGKIIWRASVTNHHFPASADCNSYVISYAAVPQ
jgi:hypothetical protein